MSLQQYNVYDGLTACRVVKTTNLSGTYFNGTLNNGVGATLTIAATSLTIDSVVVEVGDRIVLQAQTNAWENGIYVVDSIGTSVILKRAPDMQCIEQLKAGQWTSIGAGTVSAGSMFVVAEPLPAIFGVDNLTLIAMIPAGLGTASAKAVTDNTKADVASVTGSFTVDNFVNAADTSGTIQDSGFNVDNLLRVASVAVSAAEFNGMYAAPKQLIAAPGANKLIVIDRMELIMTFGSAQYADGGVVAAQYDSTIHGGGVLATNSEQASDFTGAAASTTFFFNGASGNSSQALFTASVNKGIYLSNATAAFTTGDSDFVCKIHYRIVATA